MNRQRIEGAIIETDSPRRIRITWTGRVTEADARAIQAYARARRAELGPDSILQCLVVAQAGAQIEAGARQALTTRRGEGRPWDRLAVVGGFEARVIVELIVRALRTLERETAEVRYFEASAAAEAEAIAWLEQSAGSGDSP